MRILLHCSFSCLSAAPRILFPVHPSACSRNGTAPSRSALLHWGVWPSLAGTDSIDPPCSNLLTPVSLVWPCTAMPFGLKLPRSRRYNVLSKNCFVIRIQLLDHLMIEYTLSVEGTGQECLEAVAQRLELREVKTNKKKNTTTKQSNSNNNHNVLHKQECSTVSRMLIL